MDELRHREFEALRATIRERGTARIALGWLAVCAWGLLAIATAATGAPSVGVLVPLLALVAGFEAVNQLYVTVERVGRYLEVFFEEARVSAPQWEHTSMEYARRFPGGGADPLFVPVFLMAAAVNLLPVLGATPIEIGSLLLLHLLFAARALQLRGRARRQRALDLERFRDIARRTT